MVKALLGQLKPVLGDKEKNLRLIEKSIDKSKPDLAVFAEMFLTGYGVKDSLARLAEPSDGPFARKLSIMAKKHGCTIITGFPESCSTRRGLIYNSALVAKDNGDLGTYRKLHLANFGPFEEKQYFAPGNDLPIFSTQHGKIGVMICYDTFFPELAKAYTLKGADIVVCISASPSSTRPFFEKALVSRAIENTVFVLYSNLVGTELNMVFWGGCHGISPRGELIKQGEYFKEQLVNMDLDLRELVVARGLRPTIKDTRKDVLKELMGSA